MYFLNTLQKNINLSLAIVKKNIYNNNEIKVQLTIISSTTNSRYDKEWTLLNSGNFKNSIKKCGNSSILNKLIKKKIVDK